MKANLKHMGTQHPTKPATPSDKAMNKRHLAHRVVLDNMEKQGKPKVEVLKKSIEYNKGHAKEHQKALKKAAKALEKISK